MRGFTQNPRLFTQQVVHSNGASFRIQVTSPKSILTMTKDTLNHIVWNPSSTVVDDQLGELSKFASRFGDLDLSLGSSALKTKKPLQKKKK